MNEAIQFLKRKEMLCPMCTQFVISGDFGEVDLVELLTEFKNK